MLPLFHAATKRGRKQSELMWKRRLGNNIRQMRKDLNRIEKLKKGRNIKDRCVDKLQRQCWLEENSFLPVREKLK